MKIILVIGLLTLSQCLHGQSANDLSASSIDPIRQKIMSLCSNLPLPLNDDCIKIFSLTSDDNIENILKIQNLKVLNEIIETLDKGTLTAFKKDISSTERAENPVYCLLCNLIMKGLQKMIGKNPSKEKIEDALRKVCKIFHGNMRGKCERFVGKFSQKIVEFLVNKKSTRIICKLLMVCSNKLTDQEDTVTDMILDTNILLGDSTDKHEITSSTGNEIKQERAKNPVYCLLCNLIMKGLQKMIGKNPSKAKIEDALRKVCKIFHGNMRGKCERFVGKFSQKIVEFLVNKKSTRRICKLLMVCSNKPTDQEDTVTDMILDMNILLGDFTDKHEITSHMADEIKQDNVENPAECVLCKLVMKALEKILARNPSKEKIEKALSKVCDAFRSKMKGKCQKFVHKFAGKIVDYLLKKYPPKVVCKLLMLCSDTLTEEKVSRNELLSGYTDENENIHEKLSNSIQTVPRNVEPSDVTDPIPQKGSLTSYHDIEDILNIQNLKVLNEIIEAHDKGTVFAFKNDISSTERAENPVYCLLCKLIMKGLQKMIGKNPSKEKIEDALRKVCKIFHGKMRGKCERFVGKFSQKIVKFLVNKKSTRIICKLLMVCSNKPTDQEDMVTDIILDMNILLGDSTDKDEITSHMGSEIKKEKSANSIQTVPRNVEPSDVTDPILQKIMSLCSILPVPLNDNCIKIVSLTSRDDIEDIENIQHLKVLYEIIEAHDKGKLATFEKDISSKDNVENPAECVLCKLVMKALEKILSRNPSKEKIEKALSKVCDAFRGKMKGKCQKFVHKFAGKIVDYLLKKCSPKVVCKLLMLCSDDSPALLERANVL